MASQTIGSSSTTRIRAMTQPRDETARLGNAPSLRLDRLRAEMPQAVIAEICSRRRIVRLVGLHAVGDVVTAGRRRGNGDSAVIVILVIVVTGRVIARSVITIAG